MDQFLINVAAYYKDVNHQPGWIYYQNINTSVHYYEAIEQQLRRHPGL